MPSEWTYPHLQDCGTVDEIHIICTTVLSEILVSLKHISEWV